MGVIIFLTMAIVEIAFAIFCIFTKSNQQKVRNSIRIVELIGFMVLTALSIIDWSFRYYALAILLLLLAIIGTVRLIRKSNERKTYKPMGIVLKAIGMTVLIFLLTLPAILFPQHKLIKTTGNYQVATVTYPYTDTKRIETYTDMGEDRKLNVKLWYPKDADGTYPLIVFSHGGISTKTSNESLYNELASNGYVVCSIDHTYHSLSTTDEDGHTTWVDMGYMQELSAEDAKSDRQQSYEYYQKWMEIRTGDINFVVDYILSEAGNDEADTVYKLVDIAKIGIMGHSLGGSAALGIGRMRNDVNAVIALESPFLCDIKGVENGEFVFDDKIYPVPLLTVYSDSSWSHLADWPQYAENYAMLSKNNSTAFNVHISGVGHFTLTDLALTTPLLTRMFNGFQSTTDTEYCLKVINKVCLEFFDCYLKGEGEFRSGGTY